MNAVHATQNLGANEMICLCGNPICVYIAKEEERIRRYELEKQKYYNQIRHTAHLPEVIKHLQDYCIILQSVADTTNSRGEKAAADNRKEVVTKLVDDLNKLK